MPRSSRTLARLAASRPPRLDAVDEARQRRDLVRIIATPVGQPTGEAVQRRRWRRPVRLAVALGVAAAVAVTAASLALPRAERQRTAVGRQHPAGAPQPAAFLLVSAKRLATAPATATGPYWYERTRTEVMALINAYLPPDRQVRDPYWVRASWTTHTWLPKGEGVIHTLDFQQQRFEFLSPRDEAKWKASGSPALNVLQRGVGAASESPTDGLDLGIPLAEFLRLQPDPAALQARIRGLAAAEYPPEGERRLVKVNPPKAGTRGDSKLGPQIVQKGVRPWAPGERERRIAGSMFDIATTWLRYSQRRPALQGALYRVLGGIPGVRYVGPVTDNAGRRGEAVGMVHDERGDGSRTELRVVIDPASGRLLAEQELVLKAPTARPGLPAQPAGTLEYSTSFLDSRWAGRPATGWPRNPPGVKGPVG